ncbi:MAG: hypothetical protein U0359_07060 [Byssovorax sp.]
MSLPRALIAIAAGVSSALVSIDPSVIAPSRPAGGNRPVIAASPDQALPRETPPSSEQPAPSDLSASVLRDPRGHGFNVVVRRPGHLVSLAHGPVRAAGKGEAVMHLDVRGSAPSKAPVAELDHLVWETTPLGSFATERGSVSLTIPKSEPEARLSLGAPPAPAGRFEGPHHRCAAHRDTSGGFVLLCRFPKEVTQISALNVTSYRALDGAWVFPEKEAMVRLDLPLSPGVAEARVIGYVRGVAGGVIRAEAAWAPGEEPTLLVEQSERAQPVGE